MTANPLKDWQSYPPRGGEVVYTLNTKLLTRETPPQSGEIFIK
jgi:hypothetical protein